LFGQIVVLILLQIGGLGFMTVASFLFILIGKKITLNERIIIREALNEMHLSGVVKLTKMILLVTFVTEIIGAALLSTRFIPLFGIKQGIYFSVFHAISAFCNAGFDVVGNFSSMTPFVSDVVINLTVIALVVIGGLGFVVVIDIFRNFRETGKRKLSRHTKLVLVVTLVLITAAMLVYFPLELNNPETLGDPDVPMAGKILGGVFQSVTPRTAGFSTIDQAALTPGSKIFTMMLMFIGASPAGTGGGIKTTTFAVLILLAVAIIRNDRDVCLMNRRIGGRTVRRALLIAFMAAALVFIVTLLVFIIENGRGGLFTFDNILFEVFSAFGTVGLSSGITRLLQPASKVLLIITMFSGRVGLLTLILGLANRRQKGKGDFRYPEDRIMVG